jgi:hypothetical protein
MPISMVIIFLIGAVLPEAIGAKRKTRRPFFFIHAQCGLRHPRTGETAVVATREHSPSSTGAHCPHCHLLVEPGAAGPWPPAPVRCPHCHLLIGARRARARPSGVAGAKGTAAGVFSREAKRGDDRSSASEDEVLIGIRDAAEQVGERPERLLMVDYQQLAAADPELPPLSDVFATFGSWKRARRAAALGVPPCG